MQTDFDTPFSDGNAIIYMMTEWFVPDTYLTWCAKRSGADFTALLGILFYLSNILFLHPDNPAFHLVSQHPIKSLLFLSPIEEINSPLLIPVSIPIWAWLKRDNHFRENSGLLLQWRRDYFIKIIYCQGSANVRLGNDSKERAFLAAS